LIQADWAFPDMGGLGFTGYKVQYKAPRLHFERPPGNGTMSVDVDCLDDSMRGTFVTDGFTAPLRLVRRGNPAPRAYRTVALTFSNGLRRVAGTLVLPTDTMAQRPAVILLHGSSNPHQSSLLAYATLLAQHGFIALVFDRRDAHLPGAQAREYSLNDLAIDALAAVRALKQQPLVDSTHVGLWGISQGANVAALAAGQASRPVAFVVAVSAPGVSYAQVGRFQFAKRLQRRGFTAAAIRQLNHTLDTIETFVRQRGQGDTMVVHQLLHAARQQPWAPYIPLPSHVPTQTEMQHQLWWRQLDVDPLEAWQQVRVPALLLYGSADELFDAPQSAALLQNVVGNRPGTVIRVYPHADHELMLPPGVRPDTHGQWAWPTPAPGFLPEMLAWMKRQAER
jgi:dienelactone hydrolase